MGLIGPPQWHINTLKIYHINS